MKNRDNPITYYIHIKVFKAVSMAKLTSSGVIIHLPTSKAQTLSATQRLLHPLFPFSTHTACSSQRKETKFSNNKTKTNHGKKQKPRKEN